MYHGTSACVINLEEKAAENAQTIMIFMHININANFSLIVLLRCLKPFTRLSFLQTFLTNYFVKKTPHKLINDYERTDCEYGVKSGHFKNIFSMHTCKYLSQPHWQVLVTGRAH